MRAAFALATVLIIFLAGCTQNLATEGEETPDADSLTVSLIEAPAAAAAGKPFTFRVVAAGSGSWDSDHVGAHYWNFPTQDPTGDFAQAGGCAHVAGGASVPGGPFLVTCTIAEPGTYQLRGHVRLEHDGETFNYWSQGHTVTVAEATAEYHLTATGVPDTAIANQTFTFTLDIDGPTGESDHIGAHYWLDATADPTADFALQAGGCEHQPGVRSLPGTFTVRCTFTNEGTFYLRGHLRIGAGSEADNFWTTEHVITVTQSAPGRTLAAQGVPANAMAGTAFSFELTIEGEAGTSDHIGAHYWTTSTPDPTAAFTAQAGGCVHVEGEQMIPGTFTVTCTLAEAGTYYLRGHLRTSEGGTYNYWSKEHVVTVA